MRQPFYFKHLIERTRSIVNIYRKTTEVRYCNCCDKIPKVIFSTYSIDFYINMFKVLIGTTMLGVVRVVKAGQRGARDARGVSY